MANKGKPFSDNDVGYPRITFQAPGRTFDRLLKESSLSDLKEIVRKKLGLGSGSVVQFVQLRSGQLVDLEDEDDFDAFCAVANERRHANVQIVLTEKSTAEDSSVDAKFTIPPLPPTPASALPSTRHLNANSSTSGPGAAVPRKKAVLRNKDGIEVNLETLMIKETEEHAKEDGLMQEPEEWELKPSTREALHIDTILSKKRRPGPLDLSKTRLPPSRLALARPLGNLDSITYPEGIMHPKPELNIGTKEGKFRYDRDFLIQFMPVCKEKPAFLFPLDAFGLEPLRPPLSTHNPDNRSVFMSGPSTPFRNPFLQRTEDQGVEPTSGHRTRSKRGEKKSEASKAAAVGSQAPNLEPVTPLPVTENRKLFSNNDPDSPEVVDTNVKALLNRLPMEDFDSISDQIVQWANRSEKRKDGRILIQVTRLVFEKAIDDTPWSGIYARLCKKMVDQISPKVQDEVTKNFEGKPITGGQLFCKYLLSRCHEGFECGWSAKKPAAPDERSESDKIAVDSDAEKARRQGLGLVKFIGELFKRQILTERIMHECIKKLLSNAENPEEEDIESLCTLLTTVGSLLDTRIARTHMDIYFQRMQGIGKNDNPRIQSMLQDVIELRRRNWQARKAVVVSTTNAQVHEAAVEEKADQETEDIQQLRISGSGSRLGRTRDDYLQTDGWSSISRTTARAGDLSQFGRFSKARSSTTFGPSSVFAGKDLKREPISRTSVGSNMFSALQEAQQESNKATEQPQRKKRVLQPRIKSVEETVLTDEAADVKISEDVKEFFSIRNLDEAEAYFTTLPSQHHPRLVNKLVSSAVESKERDAVLVADLFKLANSRGLCSSAAFEEGLTPTAEIIEDIAIDAPKAWSLFATMVKGAQSNEDHRTRLASKTADSDKLLGLLSDVIGLRESKWKARNAVVAPSTMAQVPDTL